MNEKVPEYMMMTIQRPTNAHSTNISDHQYEQ